jgi:hypothetical protein
MPPIRRHARRNARPLQVHDRSTENFTSCTLALRKALHIVSSSQKIFLVLYDQLPLLPIGVKGIAKSPDTLTFLGCRES